MTGVGFFNLPENFWFFWVTEVQVICYCKRTSA
ncbi:hypothetical protein CGLO_17027 [Colletotrichum gloeosporioides Cg-14]|uniref:Uncharacterized protein n=1 Tax=Colletotrichum gloeosporioides (strain Cg-14) TaxID=1237896 RepID=T0KXR7_COLGC|nr:hypothetical protein CGLO_17027 [Colletotrichum gloeosporioides Cg-14]